MNTGHLLVAEWCNMQPPPTLVKDTARKFYEMAARESPKDVDLRSEFRLCFMNGLVMKVYGLIGVLDVSMTSSPIVRLWSLCERLVGWREAYVYGQLRVPDGICEHSTTPNFIDEHLCHSFSIQKSPHPPQPAADLNNYIVSFQINASSSLL